MKAPFLIIALPQVKDPYFHQSIVLITDHDEFGSEGIVLNNPITLDSKEVISDWLAEEESSKESSKENSPFLNAFNYDFSHEHIEIEDSIFLGGPVQEESLFTLHSIRELSSISIQVTPTLFMSTHPDIIKMLIEDENYFKRKRFFLGCSAWKKDQLENEIKAGDWMHIPSFDSDSILFNFKPQENTPNLKQKIWTDFLGKEGISPFNFMPSHDQELTLN